jgi:hypothetical protein
MDWSQVVGEAAILADATGYVTFDQLNGLIPEPQNVEPEDIESLLAALNARGIRIAEK